MLGSDFDYAKFLLLAEEDEASQLWGSWQRVITGLRPERMRQCKNTALGAQTIIPWKRRYCFEAWGEAAIYTTCLSEFWTRRAARLDVKSTGLLWSDQDVENLVSRWKLVDRTRNIQTFQSRPREKRDGRSGGGKGIALGSHKSDLRISVYRRPKDLYRLEVQVSGRLLRRLITEALEEWTQTENVEEIDLWHMIRDNILGTGIDRLLKSAGLSDHVLPDEIPAPDLGLLFGDRPTKENSAE